MTEHSSPDSEIRSILEGWFGEALENMENAEVVKRKLFDRLCKAVKSAPAQAAQEPMAYYCEHSANGVELLLDPPGELSIAAGWTSIPLYAQPQRVEVTDGTYKEGDILSYEVDETTKVGLVTSHTRAAPPQAASDEIEHLQKTLRNVRGYIQNCDHEPALDEIDAALSRPLRETTDESAARAAHASGRTKAGNDIGGI